jgi:hypothetical protein
MNKLIFKSFSDFSHSDLTRSIDKHTLCIFDIDGVFFRGIFDWREWMGIIDKKILVEFETILNKTYAVWVMTNRPALFKIFSFVKQIAKSITKVTNLQPTIYSNCSQFISSRVKNYAIILNARKPSKQSQQVVEQGSKNFKKVFYIAAADLPFYFADEDLLKEIDQRHHLKNVTLIEIKP